MLLDMKSVLGLDFGKVIVASRDPEGGEDTAFLSGSLEDALHVPPSPGAIEAVRALVEAFGPDAVFVVSKCGPKVEDRSKRWLRAHAFGERTGLRSDHVRFCRERPEKAVHCRQLRITHFVDDRLDVLEHLAPHVPNLYLFGHQRPGTRAPRWALPVLDWGEALRRILARLDATEAFQSALTRGT